MMFERGSGLPICRAACRRQIAEPYFQKAQRITREIWLRPRCTSVHFIGSLRNIAWMHKDQAGCPSRPVSPRSEGNGRISQPAACSRLSLIATPSRRKPPAGSSGPSHHSVVNPIFNRIKDRVDYRPPSIRRRPILRFRSRTPPRPGIESTCDPLATTQRKIHFLG